MAQSSNPPTNKTNTLPNHRQQPIEPVSQIEPPQNVHKMQTRAKNQITKPKQKFTLTVSSPSSTTEPHTVHQALKDENWRRDMSLEYDAHITNHTWDLEPPNLTHNVIDCK